MTVAQCQHRCLRTRELFLDDHAAARSAETRGVEAGAQRPVHVVERFAHDHALAESQAVCLHSACAAEILGEGEQRVALIGGAAQPACGRYAGLVHQDFAERFRGFDAAGGGGRPEDRDVPRGARIGDTRRHRGIGPDDDEVDRTLGRDSRDGARVGDVDRDVLRDDCRSPVARRADDLDVGALAPACPGERVLPPSAADDEKAHHAAKGIGSVVVRLESSEENSGK